MFYVRDDVSHFSAVRYILGRAEALLGETNSDMDGERGAGLKPVRTTMYERHFQMQCEWSSVCRFLSVYISTLFFYYAIDDLYPTRTLL